MAWVTHTGQTGQHDMIKQGPSNWNHWGTDSEVSPFPRVHTVPQMCLRAKLASVTWKPLAPRLEQRAHIMDEEPCGTLASSLWQPWPCSCSCLWEGARRCVAMIFQATSSVQNRKIYATFRFAHSPCLREELVREDTPRVHMPPDRRSSPSVLSSFLSRV